MAHEWERDEWWNALRHNTVDTVCRPGHHRLTAAAGGGSCTLCPETIGGDEL